MSFDREVGCLVLQIDGADDCGAQLARSEVKLCSKIIPRAVDRSLDCDRPEVG